ncbi:MAG: AAA family ATPase [Thiofilum sp.]|uniref:AAA family ATPase n=1 Tax=Thiofilum sp. TaxID=2212733 RepID=UPI0025E81559|nr:AAA family ATPase [Thiofilum sp.]MBK8452165.1 AAA family ATPase [Thiofilum sp.]
MLKFPYGNSDFYSLRTEGYVYLDRTHYLAKLENAGKQLIFLRPRRFGKSLWLSTLAHYYDVNRKADFERLFGELAVGKTPTPERNQYMILRWDFSQVLAQGDTEAITQNLFRHIMATLQDFLLRYKGLLKTEPKLIYEDALFSFQSVLSAAQASGYQVYLLIDEYDNFANELLMHVQADQQSYLELVRSEGVLKTLFKAIKSNASDGKIGRVFITGVSPVVLSDMTSGYNVATNIYLLPHFNALCGVTETELTELVNQVASECQHPPETISQTLATMRSFYNGYRFCEDMTQPRLYNPTLALYYLHYYKEYCSAPSQILDGNLAMDANKIAYIASLPAGRTVINNILNAQQALTIPQLENQFGMEKLRNLKNDPNYMIALLYFFGVLTISGRGAIGGLILSVPNLVIHGLYIAELKERLLPDGMERFMLQQMAEQFYQTAELQPLAEFIETKYFAILNNRDYRWSNELTVKTAFLTLLFSDTYYIMDSEPALQRRYSDLTLITRPNMRQYALLDIVFEFKYLSLGDLGLTGEQVKNQSREQLALLPLVQTALQNAQHQLAHYRQVLIDKYQEPERLRCIAVVALGFERLVWQILE